MTILSRRSFLHGAMAAAGLVAAGIPMAAATEAPASKADRTFPRGNAGEVWLKFAGAWHLIGMAHSVTFTQEVEHVSYVSHGHREFPKLRGVDKRVTFDLIGDVEGGQALSTAFAANQTDILFQSKAVNGQPIKLLARDAIVLHTVFDDIDNARPMRMQFEASYRGPALVTS